MNPNVQRVLVATTNAGKLRDFETAAGPGGRLSIEPLSGLNAISAPEEDEATFEGNAKIKAIYYSKFAGGEIVIADDSGLEVDGLGGAPGVRSARYADDCGFVLEATADQRNNQCLIVALRKAPTSAREARYRCALAAARDAVVLGIGLGAVEGRISEVARGNRGFGYDPLFIPDGETLSMAELDASQRMQLSHRGRALNDLVLKLMAAEVF